MKRRVCFVVTARPSYSRCKAALEAVKAHPALELQLVVCASALLDRYGNVAEVIERDGFEIHDRLWTVVEGGKPLAMVKSTGLGMLDLAHTFDALKPDVVVTIADRYETLATATAAAYMNIPLVHIQGGEVTGSIDDKVRNAVTQLADVHCVATEQAAHNVLMMRSGDEHWFYAGARAPWRETGWKEFREHADEAAEHGVYVTGCPSIDLAAREMVNSRIVVDGWSSGVGPGLDARRLFSIVIQHPVTDEHEAAYRQAIETAEAIREADIQAAWFWPNVDSGADGTSKALRVWRESNPDYPVHFYRNLEPEAFLSLANRAACIVGNSSFGIREASFLGLPAINIGSRQNGRERGPNVVDVLHNRESIKAAILEQAGKRYERSTRYGDGRSGERIAEVIAKMDLGKKREAA